MGAHGDDIGFHNVADAGLVVAEQQGLDGDDPLQHPVSGDIAGIHRLLVQTHLTDPGKGLLHSGIGVEIDELRGHDRAGGVLGVLQQLIDLAAGGSVGIPQNTGYHVGGHVFNNIHRIIQIQLVQNLSQLLITQGVDDLLLVLAVLQIGEHVRRHVLGQQTKDQHLLVGLQLVQELGDVHLVHLVQLGAQGAELLGLDQRQQQFLIIILMHEASSFLIDFRKEAEYKNAEESRVTRSPAVVTAQICLSRTDDLSQRAERGRKGGASSSAARSQQRTCSR